MPIDAKADVPKKPLRHGQYQMAKKGSCPDVRKGVLVDAPGDYGELKGKNAGDVITVCANQKCKVHKHTVEQPPAPVPGRNETPQARAAREKDERAAAERGEKKEKEVRAAIVREMSKYVSQAARLVEEVLAATMQQLAPEVCDWLKIEWERPKRKDDHWAAREAAAPALQKYLVEQASIAELHDAAFAYLATRASSVNSWRKAKEDRQSMWVLADRLGVDADAIAEQAEAAFEAANPLPEQPKAEAALVKEAAKKSAKKKLTAVAQKDRKAVAAKKFPAKKKASVPKLSPEAKKRIAMNMKKRWAENRKKQQAAPHQLDRKSLAAGERAETAGV